MSTSEDSTAVFDLIGLGFGPANVAIAGAIIEKWEKPLSRAASGEATVIDVRPPIQRVLFIEKHHKFRWHPGMLLPDTRMQISFLKDLATLRSPQSPITFLAYLHSQGRLITFINRGTFTPTRKEYADYLTWAADLVQSRGINVRFGEEVIGIDEGKEGIIEVRSRVLETGLEVVRRARNIVISPGGTPNFPSPIAALTPNPRITHTAAYTNSIDRLLATISDSLPNPRPLRIAVVGSGQSAAEVLLDLHGRLADIPTSGNGRHELDMIFRKGSLKPSDDSPFANEIFDPDSASMMFELPSRHAREHVLAEYHNTNYGVVNPRTIEVLYEKLYDQKLDEDIALRTSTPDARNVHIKMLTYTTLLSASDTSDPVPATLDEHLASSDSTQGTFRLVLQNVLSHTVFLKNYDAIICGTGYDRTSWAQLLTSSNIAKHFGIYSSPTRVRVEPSSEGLVREPFFQMAGADKTTIPSEPSSASGSPPTSPGPTSLSNSQLLDHPRNATVYVSRQYRLLPVPSAGEAAFVPRVYLQGCTESAHGLSDSLLSIMGVKAGKVVDDLWQIRSD